MEREVHVLVHDIRSVLNVGSIFRTGDAVGVSKIWLSGFSPTPFDRFGRSRSDFAKTALGAEKIVKWESVDLPVKLLKKLKKDGFEIVGIEQDKKSIDYKKVKVGKKVCFVLGNEVSGTEKKILNLCDVVAEIPMKGEKESLNVSVAFGVAVFRILNI